MIEYFTMDYIIVFLLGIAIGFAIGLFIVIFKDRSQKRLLQYLIELYADKEEPSVLKPKQVGLTDEEKAKYLRIVLKSIEKEDQKIKRKSRSKIE